MVLKMLHYTLNNCITSVFFLHPLSDIQTPWWDWKLFSVPVSLRKGVRWLFLQLISWSIVPACFPPIVPLPNNLLIAQIASPQQWLRLSSFDLATFGFATLLGQPPLGATVQDQQIGILMSSCEDSKQQEPLRGSNFVWFCRKRKQNWKMCLVLLLHVYNRLVGRHSRCSRESGTQTHNGG